VSWTVGYCDTDNAIKLISAYSIHSMNIYFWSVRVEIRTAVIRPLGVRRIRHLSQTVPPYSQSDKDLQRNGYGTVIPSPYTLSIHRADP